MKTSDTTTGIMVGVCVAIIAAWGPARVLVAGEPPANNVEEQIAKLTSEAPQVKQAAATALGKMGVEGKRAIPDLIRMLEDRSVVVCMSRALKAMHSPVAGSASRALSSIGPAAVGPLRAKLNDPATTAWGRSYAITALGSIADDRVIAPVARHVGHEDTSVRLAAARASYAVARRLVDYRHPLLNVPLAGQAKNAQILVDALAPALDDDTGIRIAAMRALGELGQPALDVLLLALRNDDQSTRHAAAQVVGRTSDRRAVAPMLELLTDENKGTREAAADFVRVMATPAEIDEIIEAFAGMTEPRTRFGLSRAFRNIGSASVTPVIQALEHEDPGVREAMVYALRDLDDPRGASPVVAMLEDPDASVRRAAIHVAGVFYSRGYLEDDPSLSASLQALRGDDDEARRMAAVVIRNPIDLVRQQAVGPLIELLDRDAPEVRSSAAQALGQLRDPAAIGPLITCLNDDDRDVRKSAATALGQLGAVAAVGPLIARLNDDDGDVRESVVAALGRLGDGTAVEPLIACLDDNDRNVRRSAATALGHLGDVAAVEPLIRQLRSRHGSDAVVEALGQLGDRRATQPLVAALALAARRGARYPNAIVHSLGQIGDPRALPALIEALEQSVQAGPTLDSRIAEAVASIDDADQQALAAMTDLFGSSDAHVRVRAAVAAGFFSKEDAIRGLAALVNDREAVKVQLSAVGALRRVSGPAAVDVIFRALSTSGAPEVRSLAASKLRSIRGPRTVPALIQALETDADPMVRCTAASALGQIGDPSAREPLAQAMDSPETRLSAANALSFMADERAIQPLLSVLLESESHDEQRLAADAVSRLWRHPVGYELVRKVARPPGYKEAKAAMLARMIENGAVEAMIDALEQRRGSRRPLWALRQISGKDFGHRPALWRQWLEDAQR